MKRLLLFFITLTFAVAGYTQSYKMYIQVTYEPLIRTVSIVVGDKVVVPKDSNGQPRQFASIISVLNWLSKKGWHVEPINIGEGMQRSHIYLMSRDNTSEKDVLALLEAK